MKKEHTANEKAKILAKTCICKKDICVLYDCGYRKAGELYNQFVTYYIERGQKIFGNKIPTTEFLQYMNYDEKRVIRYAQMRF